MVVGRSSTWSAKLATCARYRSRVGSRAQSTPESKACRSLAANSSAQSARTVPSGVTALLRTSFGTWSRVVPSASGSSHWRPMIYGGAAPGSATLPEESWNRFNSCLGMHPCKSRSVISDASRISVGPLMIASLLRGDPEIGVLHHAPVITALHRTDDQQLSRRGFRTSDPKSINLPACQSRCTSISGYRANLLLVMSILLAGTC